jgi:hypothetical protein
MRKYKLLNHTNFYGYSLKYTFMKLSKTLLSLIKLNDKSKLGIKISFFFRSSLGNKHVSRFSCLFFILMEKEKY